jgi:DNA polymerase (family X)
MDIDNDYIADQFSLLSKLMDIHGENAFKTKSYAIAAYNIERLPEQLSHLPPEKMFAIKGIGEAIGKKILGILETGELRLLTDYLNRTPKGVVEMLKIKGLGPKKIATVWKEMGIESIGELVYACYENRLLLYKGFGEKTQNNIRETIEFYLKNQGSYLYAEILPYAQELHRKLLDNIGDARIDFTGQFRRQLEIIDQLEWVTSATREIVKGFLEENQFRALEETDQEITAEGPENIRLVFYCCPAERYYQELLRTSCSPEFLEAWTADPSGQPPPASTAREEDLFSSRKMHYIPACRREKASILEQARKHPVDNFIQPDQIRGIIHSHSNWSDGSNTIEQMARACIEQGYEYLVISDHSKSAFYANGLSEERIREQHHYVDELNGQLHPFRIFKSIECDILNDGHLDYTNQVLACFDLVITSVHSNLNMTLEKAMLRLLGAIENPYTTILGHMTGRLLLSRPGYPVDHIKIIDACCANQVVIELNAHPRRLDIDWRWIDYALEKGALISIDPDAHAVGGYADVRFGVLAAQKAGLTQEKNLSSFPLVQFETYLEGIKKSKGIR